MEGLNSLLIVASAFSVFCQFIDTNHKNDVQAIKDSLAKLNLTEDKKNTGIAQVKESWDNVVNHNCLRAKNYVIALFLYLSAIVLLISAQNFYLATASSEEAKAILSISHYIVSFLGGFLLVLFILAAIRVAKMWNEQIYLENKAKETQKIYKAVRASINSERAEK